MRRLLAATFASGSGSLATDATTPSIVTLRPITLFGNSILPGSTVRSFRATPSSARSSLRPSAQMSYSDDATILWRVQLRDPPSVSAAIEWRFQPKTHDGERQLFRHEPFA